MLSMTGFGNAACETPRGRFTIEIQAVNRKHLEVQVLLPKGFSSFEHEVRKAVAAALQRGAITVRIALAAGGAAASALPDLAALRALKTAWESAAAQLGYANASVQLPFLVERLEGESLVDAVEASELAPLRAALETALHALVAMRRQEGAALARDLRARLAELARLMGRIEAQASGASTKYRETLSARLRELLGSSTELDERILREVALFAERADIAEEIVRFRSHVAQYEQLLSQDATGRKMDFLIQEMGREINTVGSKAMDANIAHLVVEAKAELEKMREQVQNVL